MAVPEADKRRRLTFVRHLLDLASEQAEASVGALSAAGVLTAHDAAELVLQLVAEDVDADTPTNIGFMDYWERVDALGSKAEMKRLNTARRGLKHQGVIPHPEETTSLVDSTRRFIEGVSSRLLGVQLDELSLVPLIQSAEVRGRLESAHAALQNGDVRECLEHAAYALDTVLHEHDPSLRGERLHGDPLNPDVAFKSAFHLRLKESVGDRFAEAWDQLQASLVGIADVLRTVAVGIDYYDFRRFQSLTPAIVHTFGGVSVHHRDGVEDTPADDARWCVDFATTAALKFERRFGAPSERG